MKYADVRPAMEALKSIKTHKITDAGLRATLINNYFILAAADSDVVQRIKDAQELIMGKFKDMEEEVERQRNEMMASEDTAEQKRIAREINGHTEYFAAQRSFARKQEELLNEDVTGLTRIERDNFVKATEKEDITFGQLAARSYNAYADFYAANGNSNVIGNNTTRTWSKTFNYTGDDFGAYANGAWALLCMAPTGNVFVREYQYSV